MADSQGTFIHLDQNPKFTLNDIGSMQAVLKAGRSCLMRVVAGLCRSTRNAFLRNVSVAKSSLQPTCHIVLVLGDNGNRHGGGRLEQCGISLEDREAMGGAHRARAAGWHFG